MYLVINKCVTAVKISNFSGHYLRNRSTLDIVVLGYIGIVQHKEHSPEVLHIPPGTLCMLAIISTSGNRCSVTGVVDVVIVRDRRSKVRFRKMQVIPPELQTHVNTTIRRHAGEAW